MPHFVAFHLSLHRLPNYPFRGFQYTKGQGVPQDMFPFRNLKDNLDIYLGHVGHFMLCVIDWLKFDAKSPNQNAQICFTLPVVPDIYDPYIYMELSFTPDI